MFIKQAKNRKLLRDSAKKGIWPSTKQSNAGSSESELEFEPGQKRKREYSDEGMDIFLKGLASYCKAGTTFTFYFTILPLSRAFLSINNREMKSESGFSLAMASQPFQFVFCSVSEWVLPKRYVC